MLDKILNKLNPSSKNQIKMDISEVPQKYRKLVKKIMASSPIWGSHQTIKFPDGFVLKGGRDTSRVDILDFPKDLSSKTVLDIGCNIGMISMECKKRNASRVLGLDYNKNLIECAIELQKVMGLDIEYRTFDISVEEISDQFDFVFMLNVFHHLNEKSKIKSLKMIDKITKQNFFFEAPVHGDIIANENRCLNLDDYFSYLKGFTKFNTYKLLGESDFKRPVILCQR